MLGKYLQIFCREAEEHLASLQRGLLRLEKEPAREELLQELLRDAHTLKGSARMVALDDIGTITHLMEDLLKELESGSRQVDEAAVDRLFKGADAVAQLTAAIDRGEKPPFDAARFVEEYRRDALCGRAPAAPPPPSPGAAVQARKPHHAEPAPHAERPCETVRTEVKALDSLVNLVGELLINSKRQDLRLSRLKGISAAADEATAAELVRFTGELEEEKLQLDYLVQELHDTTMGLRMLPLQTISDGFERLVRDLSHRLGKEVRLTLTGCSTRLDRLLLQELKPMLVHLVTNAVGHGIESPAERGAAGKEPAGCVSIAAYQQGSSVLVEVRDDGRGMDPVLIRRAAVKSGVIDEREAAALSDEETLYLTLRPGFSTARAVTEIAGRGVGMDAVKKKVERLRGSLMLQSEPGRYTAVTLRLPLTLAVLEALLVRAGGETFAVPVSYVEEIVKVREAELVPLGKGSGVGVRGSVLPLCSLSALLGLPQAPTAGSAQSALVLGQVEQRICCTVDAQLGSSLLVVKGLGRQFRTLRLVFGATVLADGNPALILNVPALIAASASPLPALRPRPAPLPPVRRVLVVDDSITTRTMEKNILVTRGYRVTTAVSGEEALAKARAERFELVVTDVEMPGIDGLELCRRLRSSEAHRDIPIIVVSSLAGAEDRRRALQAGAQAYVVKGSFDQEELLGTVRALIGEGGGA